MLLFSAGSIVATPNALRTLNEANVRPSLLLLRHLAGDWGDMDAHDRQANDEAVKLGNRIFSAYTLPEGDRIWVITEADRSCTTILLPEDY